MDYPHEAVISAGRGYSEIKGGSVSSVLLSELSDGMWQPESLGQLFISAFKFSPGVSASWLASFSNWLSAVKQRRWVGWLLSQSWIDKQKVILYSYYSCALRLSEAYLSAATVLVCPALFSETLFGVILLSLTSLAAARIPSQSYLLEVQCHLSLFPFLNPNVSAVSFFLLLSCHKMCNDDTVLG